MKKLGCFMLVVVFGLMMGTAWAQEKRSSAAQAKVWVEKGYQWAQEHGIKEAIAEFNKPNGPFVKGDLYLAIFDFDGKVVAFPVDLPKIGASRINYKDPDGKYVIKEMIMIAKTKGAGWVDYKFKHPQTSKTEQKTSYVKKFGDNMVLTCGAYK